MLSLATEMLQKHFRSTKRPSRPYHRHKWSEMAWESGGDALNDL